MELIAILVDLATLFIELAAPLLVEEVPLTAIDLGDTEPIWR